MTIYGTLRNSVRERKLVSSPPGVSLKGMDGYC